VEPSPELAAAIKRQAASFDQWVLARYASQSKDEKVQSDYCQYRDGVFAAFERSEGRVYAIFYCERITGAAALTLKKRRRIIGLGESEEPSLHVVYNIAESKGDPHELERLQGILYDAQALSVQVNELIRGKQRRVLLEELYGLITDLLDLLDTGTEAVIGAGSADLHRTHLERVKAKLENSGTVQGQIAYLLGMLAGVLLLGSLAVLSGWLLHLGGVSRTTQTDLIGAFVAGGLGAVISVLARVSGGTLNLKFEMGRKWVTIVGAMRPFVGAVFGLVLFGLLEGNFVPIALSNDATTRFFTVATLSFAAGFNERWVQDALLQTTAGWRTAGPNAG
jgi:hypothetical protein